MQDQDSQWDGHAGDYSREGQSPESPFNYLVCNVYTTHVYVLVRRMQLHGVRVACRVQT